jgi:hypothetical protein
MFRRFYSRQKEIEKCFPKLKAKKEDWGIKEI